MRLHCASALSLIFTSNVLAQTIPTRMDLGKAVKESWSEVKNISASFSISTKITSHAPEELKLWYHIDSDNDFVTDGSRHHRRRRNWGKTKGGKKRWNEKTTIFDGVKTGKSSAFMIPPGRPNRQPVNIISRFDDVNIYLTNVFWEATGSHKYDGAELGVWLLHPDEDQAQVPFSLENVLEDDSYIVGSQTEDVSGHECVTLERPGRDKIWLDSAHGYAIAKREWVLGPDRKYMMRYRNSEFENLIRTMWIPKLIKREILDISGKSALLTNTCRVNKLSVNDDVESLLTLAYPKGTIILDGTVFSDSGKGVPAVEYTAGETSEDTEANIAAALKRSTYGPYAMKKRFWRRMAIVIGNVAVCAGLVGWYYFRRNR